MLKTEPLLHLIMKENIVILLHNNNKNIHVGIRDPFIAQDGHSLGGSLKLKLEIRLS